MLKAIRVNVHQRELYSLQKATPPCIVTCHVLELPEEVIIARNLAKGRRRQVTFHEHLYNACPHASAMIPVEPP
jgi:hypothetical protein